MHHSIAPFHGVHPHIPVEWLEAPLQDPRNTHECVIKALIATSRQAGGNPAKAYLYAWYKAKMHQVTFLTGLRAPFAVGNLIAEEVGITRPPATLRAYKPRSVTKRQFCDLAEIKAILDIDMFDSLKPAYSREEIVAPLAKGGHIEYLSCPPSCNPWRGWNNPPQYLGHSTNKSYWLTLPKTKVELPRYFRDLAHLEDALRLECLYDD